MSMSESFNAREQRAIVATATCGSDFAISWQRILAEARLYWPRNTAKHIATITGCGVRTAYRWLADDGEPPASAIVALVAAMRVEYAARGRIFEQFELKLS